MVSEAVSQKEIIRTLLKSILSDIVNNYQIDEL